MSARAFAGEAGGLVSRGDDRDDRRFSQFERAELTGTRRSLPQRSRAVGRHVPKAADTATPNTPDTIRAACDVAGFRGAGSEVPRAWQLAGRCGGSAARRSRVGDAGRLAQRRGRPSARRSAAGESTAPLTRAAAAETGLSNAARPRPGATRSSSARARRRGAGGAGRCAALGAADTDAAAADVPARPAAPAFTLSGMASSAGPDGPTFTAMINAGQASALRQASAMNCPAAMWWSTCRRTS